MAKALRIVDWDARYEVDDHNRAWRPGRAKRHGALAYIRLNSNGRKMGEGYRAFRGKAGKSGAACFGVFCKLLEFAGDQTAEWRGWVLDGHHRPMGTAKMAELMEFREADVQRAIEVLSAPEVAWICWDESREFPGIPGDSPSESESDTESDTTGGAGFLEFWTLYPSHTRKVGKADCLALWKRRHLAQHADQIMAALKLYIVSDKWTKANGQFVDGPHKWLNRGLWDGDLKDLAKSLGAGPVGDTQEHADLEAVFADIWPDAPDEVRSRLQEHHIRSATPLNEIARSLQKRKAAKEGKG